MILRDSSQTWLTLDHLFSLRSSIPPSAWADEETVHRLSWDDLFLYQRKTGARLNFPQQSEGALKLYIVWKYFTSYMFKELYIVLAFQLFALADSLGGVESLAEHP